MLELVSYRSKENREGKNGMGATVPRGGFRGC